MAQVNVAYDDGLLVHVDRIAAELGLSRTDYLRAVAEESVRAREQGRAMFEPPAPPIGPDKAITLALGVERVSIDLDRLARSWDKREKKLVDAFNVTEEANRTANERLARELNERWREGATPYTEMLAGLGDKLAVAMEQILAATREPAGVKTILAHQRNIATALRRARREFHFHLGESWKLTSVQIGVLSLVALIAACVAQTWVASVLPSDWLANRLSLRMYGSADAAICEMYEYSRHIERCPVLAPIETAGKR